MPNLSESIQQFFHPVKPLQSGIYHYQTPQDDPRNLRLHLRLEPDGHGVLIVNASVILHLNQSAGEYAYYTIQGLSEDQVVQNVVKRYRVKPDNARQDYQDFFGKIQTLINTPNLDPVEYLDFDRRKPYSGELSAPYRLDCALTYRLTSEKQAGYTPVERVKSELSTAEWKTILDKAWAVGIPQIVFTGGEPTLREDLLELIRHAESNNQISGLLTDGMRFSDQKYLDDLLQTGLDHVMLVLQPGQEPDWQALQNVIHTDIFATVHLTISADNKNECKQLLTKLAEIGVKAVSISADNPAQHSALQELRNQAAGLQLELVWNLPVPYSAANPVFLEIPEEEQDSTGAGKAWLYVEPDGDVLPAQGINKVLGNLLTDPWEKIWTP
jgi:organic radical activating enzyme